MKKISLFFTIMLAVSIISAQAETVTTTWGGDAGIMYDEGFMQMCMKASGGVTLFNMELIANDAPGAGFSEKGVTSDVIWGRVRARKLIDIADPRTNKAWLVIFTYRQGKAPLRFTVNGKESSFENWSYKENQEVYRYAEFPAEWLKKGRNTIELYCPEASKLEDGWEIYIARADEFEQGGGNPADVGKTSFKSTDGGESWKESPFGPLGQTRAEYTVRISLDRYVPAGWLASPVVDLWRGDSKEIIVPFREVQKMKLSIRSQVPPDTKVEYYFRKGVEPNPFAETWEPYQLIGEGEALDFETGDADLNRRYIQFRVQLSTTNPLVTPSVKSATVTATHTQRIPLHKNIKVVSAVNPVIRYSSLDWEWEKADRPEFAKLRELENLDEVVAGSRTEFEAQVKLLDYVTKRWRHNSPTPEYPGWDALSILNRVGNAGGGGMCIQFNNTLAGLCMAYGYQARLVNVVGHEICEVWNDEYGKWIFLDADYENHYNYDTETLEPLNMYDLHKYYLDYYFPGKSIDWMHDLIYWMPLRENDPPKVKAGSLDYPPNKVLTGFINAAFMRIVPRNNWYEKPYPRPLSHGSSWWPWDGYMNWYDDRTPPKRQYSSHTDRMRDMWPDLNLTHVDFSSTFGNDRLFLRFETYTPNFSHFEVNVDDTGWKKVGDRWTWLLRSGLNRLSVRAVSKMNVKGKASSFEVRYADAPFGQ